MKFEKCDWCSNRWDITFGPCLNRKEIRQWAKKYMKNRYSVDVTCAPGQFDEFWTFDSYDDALLFALRWSHL
jgi:hypothetical protein